MFAKSTVSQSMIDAVNKVLGEEPVEQKDQLLNETAPIKEPTKTGMRVYGGSYGNSAKAKQDQTKKDIDNLKGPKDKEMKEAAKPDFLDMDKDGNKKESMKKAVADKSVKEELKGNQHRIDANNNNKIDAQDFKILKARKKVKEGREFTEKLLETVRKSDVPTYLRKAKGDTPLTMADVKAPKKDSISAPENLAKARNEEVEQVNEKEAYEPSCAPITTDTLAGRMSGGKSNSFKSFKTRVRPLSKEGEQKPGDDTPEVIQPQDTPARKSHEVKEATIAGTPGWEKIKTSNVKDKSGAVHTPMSRARDLAQKALKTVQDKTKVK
jgi:hypothetical protein